MSRSNTGSVPRLAERRKVDQPSGRPAEATGVDVEACEGLLEVDEEPLATGSTGLVDRSLHDGDADASSLVAGRVWYR